MFGSWLLVMQIQFYEMGFTYCHMLLPGIVASEFSFGFSH
jgi:hypothetical protein